MKPAEVSVGWILDILYADSGIKFPNYKNDI